MNLLNNKLYILGSDGSEKCIFVYNDVFLKKVSINYIADNPSYLGVFNNHLYISTITNGEIWRSD